MMMQTMGRHLFFSGSLAAGRRHRSAPILERGCTRSGPVQNKCLRSVGLIRNNPKYSSAPEEQ
jgi:hypothetical protein